MESQPAPETGEALDRLKTLLREMFQLDRGDLDFGLYRIMNMKAREVTAFLDRDLLPQVKQVLSRVADVERVLLEQRLADTIASLKKLRAPVDDNETVMELRGELAKARMDAQAEADVYNHLANFFERYYNEGDFMSRRRYSSGGRSTYLLPYDGEEVKLHWANADQYYIKTTENYASYIFIAAEGDEARRVRFEIAAANNEKDNVKPANDRQRRFVLADGEAAVVLDGEDLVAQFAHRPLTETEKSVWPGNGAKQQERINADSAAQIMEAAGRLAPHWRLALAAPAPTEADPERTLLARHVERYTAKNSFDYFIHKDLGGFLRRELDLYLKTDVLNLDDLVPGDADGLRRALGRMRATRQIGDKIIAFLAQLEDFQKRLWLKKKLVLETHYCVTLDRVPEALWPEIAANDAQRAEWVALHAIDEIAGDLGNGGTAYSEPLSLGFLGANRHLPLDTRHFDAAFRDHLVEALSDAGPLDEQTDGLLIHAENFQALTLLQARYTGQIKSVYIDPPYNTENDDFLYKDQYKRSSWITMISDRVKATTNLLRPDGVFFCSIDHNELSFLNYIMDESFSGNFEGLITWRRRHNQPNDPTKMIGLVSEYIISYAKDSEILRKSGVGKIELTMKFTNPDDDPRGDWASKPWKAGSGQSGTRYIIQTPTGKIYHEEWMGSEQTYTELLSDGRIIFPKNGNGEPRKKYYKCEREQEGQCATNWWNHDQFGHNAGASGNLRNIFGGDRVFDNPKPTQLIRGVSQISGRKVDLMLDFFAGSGTTGHAVIDLNRGDDEGRKYILVEMGEHFDTVLLPRLKKVVYAPDWKGGKPVARDRGVSHLIKYLRLESYEDTLDGLVLAPPPDDLLQANHPALVEDYRLRYALDVETTGSPCLLGQAFKDPFAYTLSVVRDGIRRDAATDLAESFNYLLGLRIESRRRIDGVLTIAGRNPRGQTCLILWRNLERTDNAALEIWFAANRHCFPPGLDRIYANGDHTLNAIRQEDEHWRAEPIEPLFCELMFEETSL